jgi:hypothetical protein
MKTVGFVLIASSATVACGGDRPSPAVTVQEPAPACNRDGLTPAQQSESHQLLERLVAAVVEVRELADGFAFRIDEDQLALVDVSRWVDLERRCCPFFHFAIEVTPQGPTWLRLTGGTGVKDFLRAQIGMYGAGQ